MELFNDAVLGSGRFLTDTQLKTLGLDCEPWITPVDCVPAAGFTAHLGVRAKGQYGIVVTALLAHHDGATVQKLYITTGRGIASGAATIIPGVRSRRRGLDPSGKPYAVSTLAWIDSYLPGVSPQGHKLARLKQGVDAVTSQFVLNKYLDRDEDLCVASDTADIRTAATLWGVEFKTAKARDLYLAVML